MVKCFEVYVLWCDILLLLNGKGGIRVCVCIDSNTDIGESEM